MSKKNEKKSSLEKFNEENKDFKKEFAKRVTDGESAYTGKIPAYCGGFCKKFLWV